MSSSTRLLVCLALFVPWFGAGASYQYARPRVTSGLLSLYTFTEGATNPSATSSADQSGFFKPVFSNLTGINIDPLSSSWTTGRPGLHLNGTGSQTRAISTYNASTLLSLLTTSFTFELWFTPASTSQYGIIAGLGSWAPKSQDPGACRSNNVTYSNFAIAQQGSSLSVSLFSGAVSPCAYPNIVALTGSGPYHFIVTINATTITTYFNNHTVAFAPTGGINLTTWVRNMSLMIGQTVSLAPSAYSTTTWAGDIFLAAIYNRTLSFAEMQQNHAAGIPHSVPLPVPALLWFFVDVTSRYVPLPLLSYSNADTSTYAPISMYVSTAPSRGAVYNLTAAQQSDKRVGDTNCGPPMLFNSILGLAYGPTGGSSYTESFEYYVGYTHNTQLSIIPLHGSVAHMLFSAVS